MAEKKFSESLLESAEYTGLEIAVIGMAGRFPGAGNINEFWENLKNGIESIWFFTDQELNEAGVDPQLLKDSKYVKAYGVLEEIEYFDSYFFGYNPREADVMDPQMRMFHECAWKALEDAGYCPDTYDGLIGLYAGASSNSLWEFLVQLSGKADEIGQFAAFQFMDKDYLCMMVSYRLNLKGPAVVVQTACSTSLVAIHMACQAILSGECDIALAGGVTLRALNKTGYLYREGMIYSPDGHCRAFDAAAKGTIAGDGTGIAVLKRLENAIADEDHIYALVKGSAINNDGVRKVAFTAPSIEGQAEAIITAQEVSEVEPGNITYIETHGTGTELGDPVEIEALKLAFNTGKKAYCAIGSVKANVGHLDNAAGVTGFIKVALALYHRLLPPSLHFESSNPKIDFENSPFYVNTGLQEWKNPGYPLRAGVSSFGIGGTNAHIVLEEFPGGTRGLAPLPDERPSQQYQLILLSAKTTSALNKMTENLAEFFKENLQNPGNHENPTNPGPTIADAAYTLQVGRKAFKYRRMLVCSTPGEAVEILSNPDSDRIYSHMKKDEKQDPAIIFMFPGQGAQYVDMALELYQTEPIFQEEMDRCFEILKPTMADDIKGILYPLYRSNRSYSSHNTHQSHINQTKIAQPLIFMIEYALAKLLMNRGIKPYAMIGHSIGEYVAACLSGVFTLEDALEIVAARGQLMQQMPEGSMLSVPLAEQELTPLLSSHAELSLAAVNSKSHCVVSGPHDAIDTFARQLKEKGHESRSLHTSHAFHSKMMDPMIKDFEDRVAELSLKEKADIPYISNVTGTWANIEEAASSRYWAKHIRNTVRFGDGVTGLLKNESAIFVEVGPGRSLSTFIRRHENKKPGQKVIDLIRHPKEEVSDIYYLLNKIGLLWIYGKAVDWTGFYGEKKPRRISLPTYPFKGQRYQLGDGLLKIDKNQVAAVYKRQTPQGPQTHKNGEKSGMAQWFYVPLWKPSPMVNQLEQQEQGGAYLVLANEEKLVSQLVKRLRQSTREVTVVKIGAEFTRLDDNEFSINPRRENDYHTLFMELKSTNKTPHRIIHCWHVTGNENKNGREVYDLSKLQRDQDLGFYSLLYLTRAMGKQNISNDDRTNGKVEIIVLTNRMQAVTGEEVLEPQKALICGAVQVIPVEYPNVSCRSIDIDYPLAAPENVSRRQDQPESLEHLLKIIETEIENSSDTPDLYAAYRNNQRWVQTYEPTPLEMNEPEPLILKEKGVYLVTGGLGGIGLVLAGYLAKNFKARLVLTSRSPFPHRDRWDQWLRTRDTTDGTADKIRKIRELEASGAEVLILCADVADMEQMQTAAGQAVEQFGKINGIIHAAGLPDGGVIPNRTREMSETVLSPKVKGTLVLDRLFCGRNGNRLDFLVLCSSISSVLSPLGQVAYCAANAFLDTFAFYNAARNNTYTVSINWDSWQEVGMAVKALKRLSEPYTAPTTLQRNIDHPLFDTYSSDNSDQAIFISRFRTDRHWVLEEHRMLGQALLPGTAFLEMARAALEHHEKNSTTGTLELNNVFFLSPIIVNDEEEKDIRTILKKENNGYTFSITSRAKPGEDKWIEHAKGEARVIPKEEPGKYHIPGIEAELQGDEVIYHPEDWTGILSKNKHSSKGGMVFGPRWNSLRRVKAGEKQALAYLELPDAFTHELDFFKLHPALLDMATISPRLLQHHESVYMPYSYKKIKIKNALAGNVFCHARSDKDNPSQQELLSYDVTLMDEQGMELVEIEGYALRRMNLENQGHQEIGEIEPTDIKENALTSSLENTLKDALLPGEGVEVFKRVLAARKWSRVVVSTTDLLERIRESRASSIVSFVDQSPGETPDLPSHPRPELSTPYVPPTTETQQRLTYIWQQFLGIEKVGIHDDFFELGGDSLKLMTISAKIHKELDIEIPLTEFFNRHTIKKLDQYINTTGKDTKGTYTIIEPAEDKEYYPLSPGQERLYMLQQMDTDSVVYNLSFLLILEGQVNREKLGQAFSQLIRRQESFCTSFILVDGEAMQRIHKPHDVEFEIECYDLAPGDRGQTAEGKSVTQLSSGFIRPFDLTRAPLLRIGLIKTGERRQILMVDMHHIASDGTSLGIFVNDFMALYGGKPLPPIYIRYKDYSKWQSKEKKTETIKQQEKYWLNQFAGEIPALNLPFDYPRPLFQSFEGKTLNFDIPERAAAALNSLALKQEVTLFMLLFSITYILLSKLSGQEEIIIGTPIAARRHTDLQPIIGMFVNTLVLRNKPASGKTFKQFLREVKKNTLEAYENQEYSFEDLVEKASVSRDISRNPMFDVMFILQNMEITKIEIPGLILKPYEYEQKTSKFDLTLTASEKENKLLFTMEYCTKLFKEETILRYITYFKKILFSIQENTNIKIARLSIIPEQEKQRILYDFNETRTGYAADKTLDELFREQVERTPDYIAVVGSSQVKHRTYMTYISYRELNDKSNQLACLLIKKGIKPDAIVGLMVKRSVEMIIGILGILKAGGAYLPIDPQFPEERLNYMLKDSGAEILLKHNDLTPGAFNNRPKGNSIPPSTLLPFYPSSPSSLAYVIYTSGSTGKPKGVMIHHQAVHNFIIGMTRRIDFAPGKTILALTTISFDIFVLETILPLLQGLRIVIADEHHQLGLDLLEELIVKTGVDMLQATPTRMGMLIGNGRPASYLDRLKEIIVGGESFPGKLLGDLKQITSARVYNMYGPTETTVWSTMKELTHAKEIDIGQPIANTQIYILGKHDQLQPVGVIGDLYIGGDGLASGYINRQELTAYNFINQKLLRGGQGGGFLEKSPPDRRRLYKTGDLARWLPDGNIEFFGRIDSQVKIRGFRIELQEIERQLSGHTGIDQAVVLSKGDQTAEKYLCAYFVSQRVIPVSELRNYLLKVLPDYMTPSYFVQVDNIPLTPNGKIDRKALPEPGITIGKDYTAPRNDIEKKLVEIWAEVLGHPESPAGSMKYPGIGIDDNFFELGGHSLRAIVTASKIHKALDIKITLGEIFKTPTIRGLSMYIEESNKNEYTTIYPVEEREYFTLSSTQKRLYMLQQMETDAVFYNMPNVVLLEGNLDREKLEEVFCKLINRHESFRTSFTIVKEEVVQKVHHEVGFEIEYYDISKVEEDEGTRGLAALPIEPAAALISSFIRPFDLSQPPLLRVGLIKTTGNQNTLMVDIHHIISDGTSTGVLIKEFMALYGEEELPALPTRYKDYTLWQSRHFSKESESYKHQEAYWLKEFQGEIPVLNLPADFPRPEIQGFAGSSLFFTINSEDTTRLKKIASREQVSLFVLLLSIINIFISKMTGQEDISMGTQVAGRRHTDLENIIGVFINTLVIRNYPHKEKTFKQLLKETGKRTLKAFENQEYPFEDLVEKLLGKRALNRNPLFDVMFVWQNMEIERIQIPGLTLKPYKEELKATALIDLSLYGHDDGEDITFMLEYNTVLFKKETIERFINYLKEIIAIVSVDEKIKLQNIKISHDLGMANSRVFREEDEEFGF
jgi:amino acid adenylation domain-containing protein